MVGRPELLGKVDHHRKRVLRGPSARTAAKRRQRVHGPREGAPKAPSLWRPTPLRQRKATPRRPTIMGAEAPPGSESGARAHSGAPGTWEISSSPRASGASGSPHNKPEACASRASSAQEPRMRNTNMTRTRGTAERRKRSSKQHRGKDDEKSETPVVPMKPGNSPHEDPAREGASGTWNRTRERCRSH